MQHLGSARDRAFSPAYSVHLYRSCFHAVAGDISGCLEPHQHQRPSLGPDGSVIMDSSARACANLRLDRNLHFGDWVLLHPQAAPAEFVRLGGGVRGLGIVDHRSDCPLAWRRVLLALANPSAGVGGGCPLHTRNSRWPAWESFLSEA